MKIVLAFILSSLLLVSASDVLDLTSANFDEVISQNSLILVEFFAPWCGHCKKLAPEYEIAATELKKDGISIAKVDADTEENRPLAARFEIRGFPTLKVFRNGVPTDYQGERTSRGIVSYMKRQARPAVTEFSSYDDAKTFADSENVVVLFFGNADSSEYTSFKEAAETMRNEFSFGAVFSEEVAQKFEATIPSVVLFKKFDEGKNVFSGDFAEITSFVRQNSVPLIDEIGPENYKKYIDSGIPMAFLFIDSKVDGQKDTYIDRAVEVAKSTKGKVNWIWIDWGKYSRHSERVGLSGKTVPSFAIDDFAAGKHYAFDESKDVTADGLSEFVQQFLSGSLSPTIRSEEVPADNSGPVTVVVAKNFDEVVLNNDKDVLLEFYAPWCGHCKHLAPIFEEVGTSFKDQKDKIVIAKIDATANDVDAKYNIQGFPTIKFFAAGAKDTPIDYDGERTVDGFVSFLNKHSKLNKTHKDEL